MFTKNHERLKNIFEQSHSNDRQISRTKKAIRHALLALIQKKRDYESVSVKEILEEANVGRSTFYNHYQNKDEILLEAKGMLQTFMEQIRRSAVTSKSYEKVICFSLDWFEHIHETKLWTLYGVLLGPKGGNIGRQLTQNSLEELISKEINSEMKKHQRENSIPPDLLVQFISTAFLSVLSWWYEQKNPKTPKQIDAHFRSLVLPVLRAHLG